MIYFDHAATTPLDKEVLEAYIKTLRETYGNPSASYRLGKVAARVLRQAREGLGQLFDLDPHGIYFCSGATEANNWALVSQARAYKKEGRDQILASSLEHPAVKKTLAYLEGQGFKVLEIPPQGGRIRLEDFKARINEKTGGLVCMAVNNETGDILPITDLGSLAQEEGLFFHVDGVQGLALRDLDIRKVPFTSLSVSVHKYYGPKGLGFLLTKSMKYPLTPFHYGGSQEFGKRPGTVDVPGAVAAYKAMDLAYEDLARDGDHMLELKDSLLKGLDEAGLNYEVNGLDGPRSPRIVNLWIKGQAAETLLMALDLKGICLSAGSACSAGSIQASPVLKSIYPGQEDRLSQSIRLSFGRGNSKEEIKEFIESLREVCG